MKDDDKRTLNTEDLENVAGGIYPVQATDKLKEREPLNRATNPLEGTGPLGSRQEAELPFSRNTGYLDETGPHRK